MYWHIWNSHGRFTHVKRLTSSHVVAQRAKYFGVLFREVLLLGIFLFVWELPVAFAHSCVFQGPFQPEAWLSGFGPGSKLGTFGVVFDLDRVDGYYFWVFDAAGIMKKKID